MNPQVTSREAILAQCRKLVMENGLASVSMRGVAAACGVALGSLYNYFPSKYDLIAATVESVWTDIFYGAKEPEPFHDFLEAVGWVHQSLRQGSRTYPGFFTFHSLSFANQDKRFARQLMQRHFDHLRQRLLDAIGRDSRVKSDVFDPLFTPRGLIDLTLHEVIAAVLKEEGDIATLLGLLRHALY